MKTGWRKVRLEEVVEITSSKRIYASDYQSEGIPFYRGKEISEKYSGRSEVTTELFISDQKYSEIKEKFGAPETGDLLLTSVGTLGVPYVVKESETFYFKDGNLTWFRNFNDLDGKYLYYWLVSPSGKAELMKSTIGSSQPAFTIVLLKQAQLDMPPPATQEVIVSVLSTYDDLIENNTRRIKILEEMAKLIYREWFVEFKVPGIKLRKATAEEKEVTGKDVFPERWEITSLAEVLSELESGSRPKGGIDASERGVVSIGAENIIGLGQYDFSKDKFVTRGFFENMSKGRIQSGDVLLYKDGAQIGRKSLFRDGFPHDECCINEHVFILRSKSPMTQNYLFFWLDREEMTTKIRNLNANAAQPGINQTGVKRLPIVVPDPGMMRLYEQEANNQMHLLFNLAKQNKHLRATRDFLLPKLVSGEVEV